MPVPIVTFGIVVMRASLRPINNFISGHIRNAKDHPQLFKFFSTIGHGTNKVDLFLKNAGKDDEEKAQQKKDSTISDEKAFIIGIDWFTEIFFFYGTLLGVCYWEFKKFAASQKQINIRIKNLEDNSEQIMESLSRVKDRQTVTRKDLEQVLADIETVIDYNKSLRSQINIEQSAAGSLRIEQSQLDKSI